MTFKVSKKSTAAAISIFLLMTYAFTSGGIKRYVFPNMYIVFISFTLIIICMAYVSGYNLKKGLSYEDGLVVLCCTVILINRNANFLNYVFENDLAIITAFLFFVISKRSKIWHKFFTIFSCAWGVIHAIVTIFEYFIDGFYESIILPIFEGTTYYSDLIWVFSNNKMPGLAGHFSTNGIYLSVSLIVFGTLIITGNKIKIKELSGLLLVAFALLLTGKRAVLIFALFGVFVAYYVYNSNQPMKRFLKLIGIIITIIVVFTIASGYVSGLSNFIIRFQETIARGDITTGRIDIYAVAIVRFLQNPLFGTGWDSFKYFYQNYFGQFLNVHNVYLQLLCENGVIGSLSFLAFFLVEYVKAIRVAFKVRKSYLSADKFENYALMISVAMQTYFLLYCLTGNPLYDPQVFFPYICSISMGRFYVYK